MLRELNVSSEVLKIDSKCTNELREIKAEDVVIWVDPLDGTFEFAKAAKEKSRMFYYIILRIMLIFYYYLAVLEHVTVLIGVAYKGQAIAGIIHQPYYSKDEGRTVWGIKGIGTFGIYPTSNQFLKFLTLNKIVIIIFSCYGILLIFLSIF